MTELADILNEHEDFIVYAIIGCAVVCALYIVYQYAVVDPCGAYRFFHSFFGDADTLNRCGV